MLSRRSERYKREGKANDERGGVVEVVARL